MQHCCFQYVQVVRLIILPDISERYYEIVMSHANSFVNRNYSFDAFSSFSCDIIIVSYTHHVLVKFVILENAFLQNQLSFYDQNHETLCMRVVVNHRRREG